MTSIISLTFDDKTVLAALNQLARNFTPDGMRPAMMEIGEELTESTRKRFATSTDPEGTPWKPLAQGSVLLRYQQMMNEAGKGYRKKDGSLNKRGLALGERAQRASGRPLIATGELSRGIRYQVTDGGAGVEIGTNRRYAEVHQFGATIRPKTKKALAVPIGDGTMRLVKKVTIPARPFLGLSGKDKTTVLDILRHFIAESLPR
ncbi:MAG: phage virion morphogenesis protein [Zoogloeaceae bacterium]|jgi:phage virion morphogenesis protein|nr:phage virion morphogenesis protein [Zoogloeaceae bacterium]